MAAISPILVPKDICNMALRRLGQRTISSLDITGDSVADICRELYDITRQHVLRDHIWAFAKKYATISKEEDAPNFNFSAQFRLPNDYLRLVRVYESSDIDRTVSPNSYSESRTNLVADKNSDYDIVGNFLYLNTEALSLDLIYIYDITEVASFDRLFVTAFAAKLASELAPTTVSKDKIQLKAIQESSYHQMLAEAKSVQGTEKKIQVIRAGSFVDSRRMGGFNRDPRRW